MQTFHLPIHVDTEIIHVPVRSCYTIRQVKLLLIRIWKHKVDKKEIPTRNEYQEGLPLRTNFHLHFYSIGNGDLLTLNDRKTLHYYGIQNPSVQLQVLMDDLPRITVYQCLECGSDVHLRSTDRVSCSECWYPVVEKKRTAEHNCRYLAR